MRAMPSRSAASRPDLRAEPPGHVDDARGLSDEELDRRISAGHEIWAEIQEQLLATGGLPPSRELAAQVTDYLEGCYRLAEEARVEMVRRQCSRIRSRRAEIAQRGWSLI